MADSSETADPLDDPMLRYAALQTSAAALAIRRRARDALREAKEAADLASRAKTSFLAMIGHELRTPMNGILGYTQILARDPALSPRHQDAVAAIEQSGRHLLALINDLLDLSKIEANRLALVVEAVDLAGLLGSVADTIRIAAEAKTIGFILAIPPDLPPRVLADGKRLRQILLNLLGNAVKFTERGEVAFHVEVMHRDEAACRLRFVIRDTGIGIPPDQHAAIFRPFEQIGDARQRSAGTGLGLSISRELVGLMGGDIALESTQGHGSRFSFELTVALAPAIADPPVRPQRIRGYLGRRRKILLSAENAISGAILRTMVEGVGFLCDGLADPPPDAILVETDQPDMNTVASLRMQFRGAPIIAISALASAASRARALAAGASTLLVTPVEIDDLLARLGAVLALEWLADGPPVPPNTADEMMPLATPPAHEMAALLDLARAGNMRAIRERAAVLASADERYLPFASRIATLARGYRSRDLLRLIADGAAAAQS
jgi:signal transduction histidine kinase/DNA-binding NarL/FixJ family response regulator